MREHQLGIYHLAERNHQAAKTIAAHAGQNSANPLPHELTTLLDSPKGNLVGLVETLAGHIPVYQALTRQLAFIYQAPLDKIARRPDASLVIGSEPTFAEDFLAEISRDLLSEVATSFSDASRSPAPRSKVSAAIDTSVAATLIWRVGAMVAIYYQNGGRWISSRKETYQRAKQMVSTLAPVWARSVNLDAILERNREVFDFQVEQARTHAEALLKKVPITSANQLRKTLIDLGFADAVVHEALTQSKGLAPAQEKPQDTRRGSSGIERLVLPSPKQFAQQLLAGLPAEQEERLVLLAGRMDEYREAVRGELEKTIHAFIKSIAPASAPTREFLSPAEKEARSEQKRRHVNLINGLLERFNFGIWYDNQLCHLKHRVIASHPAGEVQLVPKGSKKDADTAGELWKLPTIVVVDALAPVTRDPTAQGPTARTWSDRVQSKKGPQR